MDESPQASRRQPDVALDNLSEGEHAGRFRASSPPETGAARERERLAARIGVSLSDLAAFCDRWGVEELAVFGSVLRDDFGPESDVDFLFRFREGRTPGLFTAARIRRELAELCDRPVDLVHRPVIERSRNYIRRKAILESARVVHAA